MGGVKTPLDTSGGGKGRGNKQRGEKGWLTRGEPRGAEEGSKGAIPTGGPPIKGGGHTNKRRPVSHRSTGGADKRGVCSSAGEGPYREKGRPRRERGDTTTSAVGTRRQRGRKLVVRGETEIARRHKTCGRGPK